MISPDDLHAIGTFGKPNGYKGNLVLLDDDVCPLEPDMFVFVLEDGLPVPWRITEVKPKGADAIVHLRGIETDTDAAAFNGHQVFVTADLLPEDTGDDDDIIYLSDLRGFNVIADGLELGIIENVDDTTDNVLFDIVDAGKRHTLVPAAEDFIDAIDTEKRIIEMSLPQGLLDLN